MEQSRTFKETQARTYESFSKETRQTISQLLKEGYRFRKHTIEYRDQWKGTWHFLRTLNSEEKALHDFLAGGYDEDTISVICPNCGDNCKYDAGTKEVAPAHYCSDCGVWKNEGEYVWQPDEEVF